MNIIDFFLLLWEQRRFIIITVGIPVLLAVIISLLLPLNYLSKVVIMPPTTESSMGNISSLMAQLPFGGMGLGGATLQTDVYKAILKSRTVRESTVKHFDLMANYKSKNMDDALRKFDKNVKIDVDAEGTISVKVIDRNQDRVADIANYMIDELDKTNKMLAVDRAKNNRIFFEGRVNESNQKMTELEDSLKEFQQKYNAVDIPTQTEELIKAAAEVKARMMLLGIQIDVLKKTVDKSNPKLLELQTELTGLNRQYKNMIYGGDKDELFQPISSIPNIGLEYARIFRDLEIQKKLLEYLLPEYEQARFQEVKDTPTLQVLDKAVRPFRKYKPKRSLIVITTFLLMAPISIFTVTLQNYVRKIKKESNTANVT